VAWGAVAGRSAELAEALGGRALCLYPPGDRRPPVLVRWSFSALRTAAHVLRRRPGVVVVTNPPLPAALVAWAAGRLVGARVALDTHPGGFGAQGDRVAARLQPLHRWLVRRVDLSIVAAPVWRDAVERWGGRAVVVHEAPGDWRPAPARRHGRLRVLYVGRFAADEPWQAVVEAAAACPEVDVRITGDPARAGVGADGLPSNVRLVGFLDAGAYREAVLDADVVVCLTTEPGSIMRAGCEAVWAGRPLVVSDWPAAREVFPHAVPTTNDGRSLARALRWVDHRYESLAAAAPEARRLQLARWDEQRRRLAEALALGVARP
jgi:glycosyltransferase involved in cell wall biosynthesis